MWLICMEQRTRAEHPLRTERQQARRARAERDFLRVMTAALVILLVVVTVCLW